MSSYVNEKKRTEGISEGQMMLTLPLVSCERVRTMWYVSTELANKACTWLGVFFSCSC